jgi:hypothetical protein
MMRTPATETAEKASVTDPALGEAATRRVQTQNKQLFMQLREQGKLQYSHR